ncbi:flagellar assembly protein FliX [Falsiroseomonas sp. CW058]|uniref:flagellar assembly protein FliX n=1 Tax=Falsiroseomonas sp. CW058 TaxID=3388664 RepID=UPI003D31D55E
MAPPRRGGRAGGFGLPSSAPESQAAAAMAAVAPPSLLGLQEAGAVAPDAGRAGRQAAAVLDELRGMQLDLLSGEADLGRLSRLAALAAGLRTVAGPALDATLAGVALRARLEIARRRVRDASGG